jgi:hypothetical protein
MNDQSGAGARVGRVLGAVAAAVFVLILTVFLLLTDYVRWGARGQLRALKREPVAKLQTSGVTGEFPVEELAKAGLLLDAGAGETGLIRYIDLEVDPGTAMKRFHDEAISSGFKRLGTDCSADELSATLSYEKRFDGFTGRLILSSSTFVGLSEPEMSVELKSMDGVDKSAYLGPDRPDPECGQQLLEPDLSGPAVRFSDPSLCERVTLDLVAFTIPGITTRAPDRFGACVYKGDEDLFGREVSVTEARAPMATYEQRKVPGVEGEGWFLMGPPPGLRDPKNAMWVDTGSGPVVIGMYGFIGTEPNDELAALVRSALRRG